MEPSETLFESHDDANLIEGSDEGDLPLSSTTRRINLDKNDRSLSEFRRWYERGRIIVDPEWQRKYVWDNKRASRLIESFMIGLPVPVIYLAANSEGKYEVIDGLQRLTSVFRYFRGEFALSGLEMRSEFNGLRFGELPADAQADLEDATLRTFELDNSTPKDLMFLIFERLNTGGVALNDMEIRNCLYRGALNDLIKELCSYPDFVNAISQKGIDKRMLDRMLVLRFLAFYQMKHQHARKGLKSFFNDFFHAFREPPPAKLKEFRNAFQKSMRAAFTIFGEKAFRLRRNNDKGGSEWAPKANASVFQALAVSLAEYDIGQLTRSADSIKEAYIDLISCDTQWVDSVSFGTGDYNKLSYTFTEWQKRLELAVANSQPNDKRRLFSKALKDKLFKKDPTCSICGNEISSIIDAAIDHHKQYWQGGLTVPANARLAHRNCNWERGKNSED